MKKKFTTLLLNTNYCFSAKYWTVSAFDRNSKYLSTFNSKDKGRQASTVGTSKIVQNKEIIKEIRNNVLSRIVYPNYMSSQFRRSPTQTPHRTDPATYTTNCTMILLTLEHKICLQGVYTIRNHRYITWSYTYIILVELVFIL